MKARSDRPLQGLLSLCYGNSTSHPEAPAWLQVRPLLFSKGLAKDSLLTDHRNVALSLQGPVHQCPPPPPTLSQTKLFLDIARNPRGWRGAEPPWEEHPLHPTLPVQTWSLHTRVWGLRGVLHPASCSDASDERAQFFHLNFVPCSHATPLSAQTLNPGPPAGVPG